MSKSEIPDAVIRQTNDGALTYEQNPYAWAKNTGQMMPGIYQEVLCVGPYTPSSAQKMLHSNNANDASEAVFAVTTRSIYTTLEDASLAADMATILQRFSEDGVVDETEQEVMDKIIRFVASDLQENHQKKAALQFILQDVLDDGRLNGSVPNILVNVTPKDNK